MFDLHCKYFLRSFSIQFVSSPSHEVKETSQMVIWFKRCPKNTVLAHKITACLACSRWKPLLLKPCLE